MSVCGSTPVSKGTNLSNLSIYLSIYLFLTAFSTLYRRRGHGGRSPSRANKAMVFGWKRYWKQYLVPAIFNIHSLMILSQFNAVSYVVFAVKC